MTSKEIAQATGLAPQTVDTYLKTAMSRLNAPTRRQAARQLLQQETSQHLGSPPEEIATALDDCDESQATKASGWIKAFTPPPLGGTVNELDASQRVFAVLKVAGISATTIFALTLLVAGVLDTFR